MMVTLLSVSLALYFAVAVLLFSLAWYVREQPTTWQLLLSSFVCYMLWLPLMMVQWLQRFSVYATRASR